MTRERGEPVEGAVVEAVRRDLDVIAERAPGLAQSALAATALALAREIDTPGNSATSKSMCARSLLDTLDELRELAPPPEMKDSLDELSARREARRAGRFATSAP